MENTIYTRNWYVSLVITLVAVGIFVCIMGALVASPETMPGAAIDLALKVDAVIAGVFLIIPQLTNNPANERNRETFRATVIATFCSVLLLLIAHSSGVRNPLWEFALGVLGAAVGAILFILFEEFPDVVLISTTGLMFGMAEWVIKTNESMPFENVPFMVALAALLGSLAMIAAIMFIELHVKFSDGLFIGLLNLAVGMIVLPGLNMSSTPFQIDIVAAIIYAAAGAVIEFLCSAMWMQFVGFNLPFNRHELIEKRSRRYQEIVVGLTGNLPTLPIAAIVAINSIYMIHSEVDHWLLPIGFTFCAGGMIWFIQYVLTEWFGMDFTAGGNFAAGAIIAGAANALVGTVVEGDPGVHCIIGAVFGGLYGLTWNARDKLHTRYRGLLGR